MTEKDPPNHKEEPNFIQIYSKRKLPLIESANCSTIYILFFDLIFSKIFLLRWFLLRNLWIAQCKRFKKKRKKKRKTFSVQTKTSAHSVASNLRIEIVTSKDLINLFCVSYILFLNFLLCLKYNLNRARSKIEFY